MTIIVIIDSVGQSGWKNIDPSTFARKIVTNYETGEASEIRASDFAGIPYLTGSYTNDLFEKVQNKKSKGPILELELVDGIYSIKK